MKFNKYLLASVVATALSSAGVQAADGTITFNGLVTSSACTSVASVTADSVVTGAPISATLRLPNVTTTTLNAAVGTYAEPTPFSIRLTGCEATTALNNVRTRFISANFPDDDTNVMANTATLTPATNVAIAILRQNGTSQIDLNNGTNEDPGLPLPQIGSSGDVTLNYKAAYKSLTTGVTAGNVTGVADFTISYF
ncbi:fimbrial protein [Budvicia diplopodorum]|uniref:fimbrial protein n=1 Tax=Budvicia diplopodorum TaxID=1119056 RepID=UPI001357DBA4|nr:fimbrial protein [Budvicia diplopodorum]